jgi:hypothetical protein
VEVDWTEDPAGQKWGLFEVDVEAYVEKRDWACLEAACRRGVAEQAMEVELGCLPEV